MGLRVKGRHFGARALLVMTVGLMASACAYNYASREGRRTTTSEASTEPAAEANAGEPSASAKPDEPKPDVCAQLTFEVHYFDDEARQTRQVACEGGEVLSIQRAPTTGSFLDRARQARHPERTWFVLVDPEGLRTRYLTNRQLRELQSRYQAELVGRDPVEDVLIYQLHIDGF